MTIRRVHLIFKTHLDVGFTDLAGSVVAGYFERHIPAALALAQQLRQTGAAERFVWTTGSWLIYEYLEQASPAARARMEAGIAAGDIAWHALPFTFHSELLDPGLFRFGLSLSQELDRRFGKTTIAAKMTDVPGHTRGSVPLLAAGGVRFLHIGVNPASTPPDVPPVFVWRDPTGAQVMVMYHKGSYGEAMTVPGLDEAIEFAHTGDNLGPQSPEEIQAAFAAARLRFPGAEIVASTLDAYAAALGRVEDQLPLVTQEIGDTWIHGAGSDPAKVSQYRQLLRLRRQWLTTGRVAESEPAFTRFSRALLLIPEHTWGLDIKTHLGDFTHYAAPEFQAARAEPGYRKVEASWDEQRGYLRSALQALGDSPLAAEAKTALQALEPVRPEMVGFELVPDPTAGFDTTHFTLAFDERGAITRLLQKSSGTEWASRAHPLGLFRYETFSAADYARFYGQYIQHSPQTESWARPDFTKPGLELTHAEHRDWLPTVAGLYQRRDAAGQYFLLSLALPDEAHTCYGCPREVFVSLCLPAELPEIHFKVQWFQKPACRLPEAAWFSIAPQVQQPERWLLDKLGEWISPLDVIHDGNRSLHAVGVGAAYRGPEAALELDTPDAPLIAPGERALLNFNNAQPDLTQGFHILLLDNLWGTNFRMWYDNDAVFRFRLRLAA